MKVIKLFLLFFLFQGMLSGIYSQNNEEVIVRGKLINVENFNEVYLKYSNKKDTVPVDNNLFEANLDIEKPQYLYFTIGLENYPVFIFPGDFVNIELEKIQKLQFIITIKSNYPVYTDYFNLVNNTSTLLNKDTNTFKGGEEYLYQKVDTIYKINTDYFNNIISSNSNLDDNFVNLEPLRLYLSNKSMAVSFSGFSIYKPENINHMYNDSVFKAVSREINLDNPALMNIEEYKSLIITNYTYVMTSQMYRDINEKESEEEKALAFDLSMCTTLKTIDADFSYPEITDYLKYYYLSIYMPYSDKVMLDSSYSYFIQTCKDQKYIDNLKAMEKPKKEKLTGKKAPDFSCNDITGKKYSLSDFKGKYVYIDFWATWCKPCREETPSMKALHDKYKDNKDLVIISLSIDEDKDEWKKVVKDENMNWLQLYTPPDSKFLDEYQVESIPRFVLIDKEGIILNPDSPRPSYKKLTELLDKYLKK